MPRKGESTRAYLANPTSMLPHRWWPASFAATAMFLSACTIPITVRDRHIDYQLDEAEFKRVQLFISDGAVLRRGMVSGEVGITPGAKVRVVQGVKVEEIVIPKHTKGVVRKEGVEAIVDGFCGVYPPDTESQCRDSLERRKDSTEFVCVAFDPQNPNDCIVFGATRRPSGTPPDDPYVLVAYADKIPFAGKRWTPFEHTRSGDERLRTGVHLRIRREDVSTTEKSTRVLEGIRVGE